MGHRAAHPRHVHIVSTTAQHCVCVAPLQRLILRKDDQAQHWVTYRHQTSFNYNKTFDKPSLLHRGTHSLPVSQPDALHAHPPLSLSPAPSFLLFLLSLTILEPQVLVRPGRQPPLVQEVRHGHDHCGVAEVGAVGHLVAAKDLTHALLQHHADALHLRLVLLAGEVRIPLELR